MYRGTIYLDPSLEDSLLSYLDETGWIIEEDEHFERKGIRRIEFSNDYNEIYVQIEKGQKIEIDGRELILKEIDTEFNDSSTLLRTDT